MDDQRLERLETMLQATLDAICALAEKSTGSRMAIGGYEDGTGAVSGSEHVKWVKREEPKPNV